MKITVVASFSSTNSVMHATNLIVMITLLMLLHYSAAQSETFLSSPPPPSSKSNGFSFNPHFKWNPSMAVIIICLLSAFFVMGCISVYVRQCAEQRLMDDLTDNDNTGSQRRPRRAVARGLDPTIIDTFPMFLYSDVKGLKLGKGTLECAVCLNEFEVDETLRLLPKCSHVFHPDCVDAWLASHITCPVCRANLIPKPEEIGSCDSLSHHLFARPSDSVPPQEVSSAPEINNLVMDIRISSPPEVINPCQTTDHNLSARPAPKRPRINGKFSRSHSMGHLLVEPGEDCERFTLRLPEEVRSQLMKSELTRAKSCVALPRVKSSRKGFRSNSGGTGRGKSKYYERFDREVRYDRWGFTVAPPFFSRGGSTRWSKNEVVGEEIAMAPRNLFRSVKSPFDRMFSGKEKDNDGERSFNRLSDESLV